MSFRARVTLLTALAIAVTVSGASLAVWLVAKHELYAQLDQTLTIQATSSGPYGGRLTEVIHPDGDTTGPQIPVTQRAVDVANGRSDGYYTDVTIGGIAFRELVLRDQPNRQRRSRHGHGDRDRRVEHEPLPEAHGSSRSA